MASDDVASREGMGPDPGVRPPMPLWLDIAGLAIVSGVLSAVMAAVMSAVNVGLNANFMPAFLSTSALGFVVSLPVVMLVLPPVIRWQRWMVARRPR